MLKEVIICICNKQCKYKMYSIYDFLYMFLYCKSHFVGFCMRPCDNLNIGTN